MPLNAKLLAAMEAYKGAAHLRPDQRMVGIMGQMLDNNGRMYDDNYQQDVMADTMINRMALRGRPPQGTPMAVMQQNDLPNIPGFQDEAQIQQAYEFDEAGGYGQDDYRNAALARQQFETSGQVGPPTQIQQYGQGLQQMVNHLRARKKYMADPAASDRGRMSSM